MSNETVAAADPVEMTAQIAAAYVSNNRIPPSEVPALIRAVHMAMAQLTGGTAGGSKPTIDKPTSAQVQKSITPDALISFEDGKPYKTLRRHLTLRGLSPESYRAKWGLAKDYPMTAASYSEQRSALAKSLGLGRIGGRAEPAPAPAAKLEAPKKARGRKAKAPTSG